MGLPGSPPRFKEGDPVVVKEGGPGKVVGEPAFDGDRWLYSVLPDDARETVDRIPQHDLAALVAPSVPYRLQAKEIKVGQWVELPISGRRVFEVKETSEYEIPWGTAKGSKMTKLILDGFDLHHGDEAVFRPDEMVTIVPIKKGEVGHDDRNLPNPPGPAQPPPSILRDLVAKVSPHDGLATILGKLVVAIEQNDPGADGMLQIADWLARPENLAGVGRYPGLAEIVLEEHQKRDNDRVAALIHDFHEFEEGGAIKVPWDALTDPQKDYYRKAARGELT